MQAVHPRRRGEHALDVTGDDETIGSSPQARGTPHHMIRASWDGRFIPAGAGNTDPRAVALRLQTVHPRRRGEHGSRSDPTRNAGGSSPQARGTRLPE